MLKKRGDTYYIDIHISGHRIRRSLDTKSLYIARRLYKAEKEAIERQHGVTKTRLEDFASKYLDHAWIAKPSSAQREEQRLRKILTFFKVEHQIIYMEDVGIEHLEGLRAHLLKQKLAKATVNRYLQILRRMYNVAIDWEVFTKKNPLTKIRFYTESSPRLALTEKEVEKAMAVAREISEDPRSRTQMQFYDLFVLALNTGLRKSEVLNIRWKDVKENHIVVSGKGGKTRNVPSNNKVRAILERLPKRYEHVFNIPNRNSKDVLRKTIERVKKDAGIEFTFHQIRHTFATRLLKAGVDIITLASILGHSKTTTSLIYGHTDEKRKREAVERLDEV